MARLEWPHSASASSSAPTIPSASIAAGKRSTAEEIAGYDTLVVGQVEYSEAPERLMLLARFAIATAWQGKGLGSGLLKDAMLRTLQAADIAGIRAFAVHAKDDNARSFYERFDFVPSPGDPYHLFRLLKDIRIALKA